MIRILREEDYGEGRMVKVGMNAVKQIEVCKACDMTSEKAEALSATITDSNPMLVDEPLCLICWTWTMRIRRERLS